MKRSILVLSALSLLLLAGACRSKYMVRTDDLVEPGAETAVLRFQRYDFTGRTVRIMLDRKLIGNLKPRMQFDFAAPPGHHLVTCIGDRVDYMEVDLAAGRTYTVRVSVQDRSAHDGFVMVPVKPGTVAARDADTDTKTLNRYTPNLKALEYWASGKRIQLEWAYEHYEDTAKAQRNWPVVRAEYGR